MSIEKPLVSLVLLSYNQTAYIEDALKGVFAQDYSNLEVIISDDCSPDNTFEKILEYTKTQPAKKAIKVIRNKENLGLIDHINKLMFEDVNGEIVIMAAGDDISLPSRVSDIVEQFIKDDSIYSVSTGFVRIDEHNTQISDMNTFGKDYFSIDNYCNGDVVPIFGCSRAYRREVFSFFGPLEKYASVEDATLVFRSLLLGNSYHLNKIGLQYRVLSGSLSSGINLHTHIGKNRQRIKDTELAITQGLKVEKVLTKLKEHKKKLSDIKVCLLEFQNRNYSIWYYLKNILFSSKFQKSYKLYLLKQVFSKEKKRLV